LPEDEELPLVVGDTVHELVVTDAPPDPGCVVVVTMTLVEPAEPPSPLGPAAVEAP
jgi:hypothetical protein